MKKPGDGSNALRQMREDWDDRAKKDANFYVAFGRHRQAEDDFLASAADVMPALEQEFSRLPSTPITERRALEIGCGPGRLMLPITRFFGEVHGVDISEEMVALARQRLADIANAHVHATSGNSLALFADRYFDFVYSYIVFQHIPDREIVLHYLREAQRVLKPGGVLRCQVRGTAPLASEMARESKTWTGCFFDKTEIVQFSREFAFPLVAISGLNTQYMWTTFRKPPGNPEPYDPKLILVKDVTAASKPGSRIPSRGRDAAVSLWIDGMPDSVSLADLEVWFGDQPQLACYVSPVSELGGCQLNARVPDSITAGEYTVRLKVAGHSVERPHVLTVFAAPSPTPRIVSVTDGVNLTLQSRLETRSAKVTIEGLLNPSECIFTVADRPVEYVQYECTDPITLTYAFAFHLRRDTPRGRLSLLARIAGRELDPVSVEVPR